MGTTGKVVEHDGALDEDHQVAGRVARHEHLHVPRPRGIADVHWIGEDRRRAIALAQLGPQPCQPPGPQRRLVDGLHRRHVARSIRYKAPMHALRLTRDTVGPIARGHPWVYADGVSERPPCGEVVRLVDDKGRTVAFGLADEGDIAVRVLGRHPEPLAGLLEQRLQAALALRAGAIPARTDTYRLVNGAGDWLPGVVVDRYADTLVLRLYSKAWEPHLPIVVSALQHATAIPCIVRKLGVRRVDGAEGIEVLHGTTPSEPLVVREAGLSFLARPSTGQKTGLFLDQRENRRFLAPFCRDRTVVNLFAYNGGFSVHAAAAGARRVTSVDIAADALDDARESFRLNGLDPDKHRFEARDAFSWDEGAEVMICDPPSLSHGNKADKKAERAYRDLNEKVARNITSNGLLATASCTSRLSFDRWERAVRDGLKTAGRFSVLWRATEPPDHPVLLDHPEGRYLKFALLVRR